MAGFAPGSSRLNRGRRLAFSQKPSSEPRMLVMATAQSTPAKPKPVAGPAPAFTAPKFDMPKFEMPKMEVPPAFREIAEKGIAQAKENYEKVKSAAEKATDTLETAYTTASTGCSSYGLKLIETVAGAASGGG